jgi:hypothetical protein
MKWNRFIINENTPVEGERVLVSDGEVIVIGYYILSENHLNWFYGVDAPALDFDVQWWQSLPELPPKIENAVDKV